VRAVDLSSKHRATASCDLTSTSRTAQDATTEQQTRVSNRPRPAQAGGAACASVPIASGPLRTIDVDEKQSVHLLLGDTQDPCCLSVQRLLEAREYPTRIVSNPLEHPSRFAWRLDGEQSASQLGWNEQPPVLNAQIRGVLVRSSGWIDPTGWQPADLTYMQAETQAALLAWIWSLACPVINRYPSGIWYQPQLPLLFWHRLLGRCGLPTLDALVTNVDQEARAFGRCLDAEEGVAGAIYGPLTSDVHYLVTSDQD